MKYLIVGLGNIGVEYENTRHNIGFDIIDALASEKKIKLVKKTLGSVGVYKHRGRSLVLLKPSTYMNLSGKAVNYYLQSEKIPIERVLIVLDDLNINFGAQRLRPKGSDGGHNGLKNINQILGKNSYARLRIGIGNTFTTGKQVNFVIGKWSNEESKILLEIIENAKNVIKDFTYIGIQRTMSQHNKK